jgi:tRNA G26 N,N-dimethylase Trm1
MEYRYVIANDLSSSAVDVMRKNVEINGLHEQIIESTVSGDSEATVKKAKVQVNEGDAWLGSVSNVSDLWLIFS